MLVEEANKKEPACALLRSRCTSIAVETGQPLSPPSPSPLPPQLSLSLVSSIIFPSASLFSSVCSSLLLYREGLHEGSVEDAGANLRAVRLLGGSRLEGRNSTFLKMAPNFLASCSTTSARKEVEKQAQTQMFEAQVEKAVLTD